MNTLTITVNLDNGEPATESQIDRIGELAYQEGFGTSKGVAQDLVICSFLTAKGVNEVRPLTRYEAGTIIQALS